MPHEIARDLPRYAGEALPHAEATHVDRNVEARARAMTAEEVSRGVLPGHSGPRDAVSGFGAAMLVRVRFAGGEVPIWSLVVPLVIVVALAAALGASLVSGAQAEVRRGADSSAELAPSVAATAAAGTLPPTPAAERLAQPETPVRARSTHVAEAPGALEGESLGELPPDPSKYTAAQLLAIAEKRSVGELALAREFDAALERDPGLIRESKTLSELRRLAENPETARIALGAVAELPAPMSADLLYELWTGTVERTQTTELARALLFSKDVRPKASAALAVALDLRVAERCEDAKAILPRAIQDGDRRSLPLVIKLQRKYGCGTNKRMDCYPCLRSGDELENAIKAVKERREPRALSRR